MQEIGITGVGQIHISINDYDRALHFYRDILGLSLLFEVHQQKMAFFDCGGVRLYIGVPSSPEYAANSFIYYRVNDIDQTHRSLIDRGVSFLNSPQCVHKDNAHTLWMAGFKDSEGNYVQLMEEKPI